MSPGNEELEKYGVSADDLAAVERVAGQQEEVMGRIPDNQSSVINHLDADGVAVADDAVHDHGADKKQEFFNLSQDEAKISKGKVELDGVIYDDMTKWGSHAIKQDKEAGLVGLTRFDDGTIWVQVNPTKNFEGGAARDATYQDADKEAMDKGGARYRDAVVSAIEGNTGKRPVIIALGAQKPVTLEDGSEGIYFDNGGAYFPDGAKKDEVEGGVFVRDVDLNGKQVKVCHVNVSAFENTKLDSKEMEALHGVLEILEDNPVTIHCTDGLDRAGGFSLAIYIYKHFDDFAKMSAEDTAAAIQAQQESMQARRGGFFCTRNKGRLAGAMQLANIWKCIDASKKVFQGLDHQQQEQLAGLPYQMQILQLRSTENLSEAGQSYLAILESRHKVEGLYFKKFANRTEHLLHDVLAECDRMDKDLGNHNALGDVLAVLRDVDLPMSERLSAATEKFRFEPFSKEVDKVRGAFAEYGIELSEPMESLIKKVNDSSLPNIERMEALNECKNTLDYGVGLLQQLKMNNGELLSTYAQSVKFLSEGIADVSSTERQKVGDLFFQGLNTTKGITTNMDALNKKVNTIQSSSRLSTAFDQVHSANDPDLKTKFTKLVDKIANSKSTIKGLKAEFHDLKKLENRAVAKVQLNKLQNMISDGKEPREIAKQVRQCRKAVVIAHKGSYRETFVSELKTYLNSQSELDIEVNKDLKTIKSIMNIHDLGRQLRAESAGRRKTQTVSVNSQGPDDKLVEKWGFSRNPLEREYAKVSRQVDACYGDNKPDEVKGNLKQMRDAAIDNRFARSTADYNSRDTSENIFKQCRAAVCESLSEAKSEANDKVDLGAQKQVSPSK